LTAHVLIVFAENGTRPSCLGGPHAEMAA
jgi:hypothetical protein